MSSLEPTPVVSWLAPFIGHVGICREHGAISDFLGSNLVNVEDVAFGTAARYVQLDGEKCCFPPNLAGHTCKHGYQHAEYRTAVTWDDALRLNVRYFEQKSYSLLTLQPSPLTYPLTSNQHPRGNFWAFLL